jgi:hypothetical protein
MQLWDMIPLTQNQTIEGPVIDLSKALKLVSFSMFWAFGGAGTFRVEQTWAPTRDGVFTDGTIIVVDKAGGGARVSTTNRAVSGSNVATLNTGAAHGLIAAEYALITGLRDSSYNGIRQIASAPSGTQLTYPLTHAEEIQVADTEGRVVEIKSGSLTFTPITSGGFVKFRAREMNVGAIDVASAWLCYQ